LPALPYNKHPGTDLAFGDLVEKMHPVFLVQVSTQLKKDPAINQKALLPFAGILIVYKCTPF
jgi:hypothetical protein